MNGQNMASSPGAARSAVLAVLAILTLPDLASAAASCMSPPPGADQSLYSACLGLASQLATMPLPSNGASVVLTTQVELPVSTSTILDPFGFPTAIVPVTGTSQTSASSVASSATSGSSMGSGSSGTQGGAVTSSSSSASQSTPSMTSTMSTAVQGSEGSSSPTGSPSQTATSSTKASGAAAATGSPSVTQSSVDKDNDHYRNTVVIPVAVVCTVVPVLLIIACIWLCYRRRKRRPASTFALASAYGGENQPGAVADQDRVDSGLAVNGMTEVKGAGRDPFLRNPPTNVEPFAIGQGAAGPSVNDARNAPMPSTTAETAAPTAYHSAKPSVGSTGHSNAMGAGAGAGASGAAVAAAASSVNRPKSRSSSHSRPESASRFAGWMTGRSRANSRTASRQGTAHSVDSASGRASIANEQPPTLPGMPAEMGSGKWFEGQDPGKEYNEPKQIPSLKAGSSIYDERDGNSIFTSTRSQPFEAAARSSVRGSGAEGADAQRSGNVASGLLNPFSTPLAGTSTSSELAQRQESQSTHRSSDVIPVGGSASTEAAAAARNAEDESLFGPYRPPTPYDELSMLTSARARGNTASSYTSPSTVGNVVQGPFITGTGSNYSRPVPAQIQTLPRATAGHSGTNGGGSGIGHDAFEQNGTRATSPRHASPPPSSPQQVMYYPSQEEARTFDFGRGPGSPIGESREMFYDASEDR